MALARPSRLSARWLVVASIVLAAGFLLPALHNRLNRLWGVEKAPVLECRNNLRMYGMAMRLYAEENGGHLPPRNQWEALLSPILSESCRRCPGCPDASSTGYVYLGDAEMTLDPTKKPPELHWLLDTPLMMDSKPRHNNRRNVYFLGEQAINLTDEEVQHLLERGDTAMKITIKGKEFTVRLAATEAAKTLQRLLPLALEMTELNGNEKYANLAQALPATPQEVRRINAGDMMLWGDDCLVIFYQSFNTPYSYTHLGRILDPDGLAEALGNGSAHVELK